MILALLHEYVNKIDQTLSCTSKADDLTVIQESELVQPRASKPEDIK